MARYSLSERAEADYFNIFYFGAERFGRDQAVAYTLGLDQTLTEIAEAPLRYEVVASDRRTFRRATYRSHAIYFELRDEVAFIVRILGRQDLAKAFR